MKSLGLNNLNLETNDNQEQQVGVCRKSTILSSGHSQEQMRRLPLHKQCILFINQPFQ